MTSFRFRRWAAVSLAAAVLAFGPPQKAVADVIRGSSLAFGESVSLTFTPVIGPKLTLPIGPFPLVAGAAPAPYNLSQTAFSPGLPPLTISALSVNASSDVDGLPGTRIAAADSTVNSLTLGPFLGLPPLLTLSFTSIGSQADASGDSGNLSASAKVTLIGAIAIPLLGISSIAISNPAANTELLSPADVAAGFSILLNDLTFTGNGITTRGVDLNAIDISFTNYRIPPSSILPQIGTLNGDILIGHAEAQLLATPPPPPPVPEPPTVILAAVGCLVLMFKVTGRLRKQLRRGWLSFGKEASAQELFALRASIPRKTHTFPQPPMQVLS